jgi:predicted anti-sigma-YlaC factor YlaD
MHDIVVNELEDHLAGTASPAVHAHLAACPECRTEVESMAQVSQLLADLKADQETAADPSPYFYTRVAASIVEHQNTDHWGLLAPGAAFFRRVAFASLIVLACLGSYLVMREGDMADMSVARGTDPAAVIAQHDSTADHAASSDRNLMLVTLASYGE